MVINREAIKMSKRLSLPYEFKGDVQKGDIRTIIREIANGFYVNTRDHYDWSLLDYAADCGDKEIAFMLLLSGADVEASGKFGFTPLTYAARRGHAEIIKMLIDNGM